MAEYNLVYIARSDSEHLQKLLEEKKIHFCVKDGPYDLQTLKSAAALVPGKLPVTRQVLEYAANLKVVSKYGVGLDRIDVEACTERGILVCNAPTVNNTSVAEHAITLLLMAAKHTAYHDRRMQQMVPQWREPQGPRGIEVTGKTVSIIGLGHIGCTTAQLAHGLGMQVVGYDPFVDRTALPEYVESADTLPEAMAVGDFVSIHVAGSDKTRGMIGEKELACMKKTALLINTTRGFVVDEAALAKALDERRIAGAAVDVLSQEPVSVGCTLLHRENVVITPHCAANTVDAHLRSEKAMAENIFQVFAGVLPATAVNGSVLEREKP